MTRLIRGDACIVRVVCPLPRPQSVPSFELPRSRLAHAHNLDRERLRAYWKSRKPCDPHAVQPKFNKKFPSHELCGSIIAGRVGKKESSASKDEEQEEGKGSDQNEFSVGVHCRHYTIATGPAFSRKSKDDESVIWSANSLLCITHTLSFSLKSPHTSTLTDSRLIFQGFIAKVDDDTHPHPQTPSFPPT